MKGKKPMPGYYGKNIVRNAQRKFLQRKALEADSGDPEKAQRKRVLRGENNQKN
jgi:hypothetical protein